MKHKLLFINEILKRIKSDNTYRKLKFGSKIGTHININNQKLLNLCSNDYLSISNYAHEFLGQIECCSRSIISDQIFKSLETKLAKHKMQESSLIYPTGYMANLGTIPTIIQNKNDIILSDELNHASIIDSCKLTNKKIIIYKHNNMEDLESKTKSKKNRIFIITEGVFSMDGDFANLKRIVEIAEKKNAVIILDDAHGDFVLGEDGKGTANYFQMDKKIDVYISSLSKGLGSFGGYISSQHNLIKLCINRSKSFIYTSALPSQLVQFTLKKFNSNREKQRKKLWYNVNKLKQGLEKSGYMIKSNSHIIPIIIGSEKTTILFSKYLLKNGIYAMPIRYPTVSKNKARIRISVTAGLSDQQIEKTISTFDRAISKFQLDQ